MTSPHDLIHGLDVLNALQGGSGKLMLLKSFPMDVVHICKDSGEEVHIRLPLEVVRSYGWTDEWEPITDKGNEDDYFLYYLRTRCEVCGTVYRSARGRIIFVEERFST